MTTKSRYFVIASLLVLVVGVGTGLVAYYVAQPTAERRGVLQELELMPADAAVVAFANVHDVMTSELRQRLRHVIPHKDDGQREFETKTGINIETDVDRVVACLEPTHDTESPSVGLVLARGRFNEVQIEALMRDHGGNAETYKSKRLIVNASPNGRRFALAFLEPALVALGSETLVRGAIDHQPGGPSVVDNPEVMKLVRSLDNANAWAVGRFDVLRAHAKLPSGLADRLPPITWFSVSGHVDGGINGLVRAETRDQESAKNLRDVVRGLLALARLQGGADSSIQTALDSLELGGDGTTVALSFAVPGEVFDKLRPTPNSAH